jgi:hypothetical protein
MQHHFKWFDGLLDSDVWRLVEHSSTQITAVQGLCGNAEQHTTHPGDERGSHDCLQIR